MSQTFIEVLNEFQRSKGRTLTRTEIAACRQLWETTIEPQLKLKEQQ